tara:strand:+ start:732 stop:1061 length:330 start_codon:yes stop_codon:yes gene_type:complete
MLKYTHDMVTTPEGKIKVKLDKMLKSYGKQVWYYNPQAGAFGRAGIPDKILCVNGHFIGVECKADRGKKPTALQLQCMKQIELAKGVCFVVYDNETIEHVRLYIERLIK